MSYGFAVDFSTPFLAQYRELLGKVPRQGLMHGPGVIDAAYANYIDEAKSVYLSYSVIKGSEHVFYSKNVDKSEWIFDSFDVTGSHHCFQNIGCAENYNCAFAYFSRGCIDSSFIYDCVNCKNCLLCTNLRNKEYCIRNKRYPKEEYAKFAEAIDLGDAAALARTHEEFKNIYAEALHKYARVVNSPGSTGDDLKDSKGAKYAFSAYGAENGKYLFRAPFMKDSMDVVNAGWHELSYEFIGGGGHSSQLVRFCSYAQRSINDAHYIDTCNSSSYLFGCVGLKSKQHCVLNRQYTKEEYESLIPRIIEHMNTKPYVDEKGRAYKYGEFFPAEFSPFAYNETVVQEYFPLTRTEAETQGYRWRESEEKTHTISRRPEDLPPHVKETPDSVLSEVIGCAHGGKCNHQCTAAFRIVPEELERYRKMGVALPRLCPNCRHYERLSWRNSVMRLWHRQCACDYKAHKNTAQHTHHPEGRCQNEFETPYAPERPEIVYCEQCYNAEVV
jgi:hypothetical protein